MKILFQGDSITDAGRNRENPGDIGPGYPKFVVELLKKKYPDVEFEFVNRGISGDRTEDLVRRWQQDCIAIAPDIVSIMIGVNDTWHHTGLRDWETDEFYENNYRSLLRDIKEKTNAKILILEQYVIPDGEKENVFYEDMASKMLITRKLAREYADAFVPTDGLFAAAMIGHDYTDYSPDGVHPNDGGSAFIAKHYVDAVSPIIDALLSK